MISLKTIIVLILTSIILISCKKEKACPDEYTIGPFETPDYIKDFIKYDEVENFTFISESNDSISFTKIEENHVENITTFVATKPCNQDSIETFDYFFEREITEYRYISSFNDTIRFVYYPILTVAVDDFSDVDIDFLQHYHYMHIILEESETRINEGRAAWESMDRVDSFARPLEETFTIQNINYDDVFFLEGRDDKKVIFYTHEQGLIGFTDENDVRWIRKK